jgi:hypothetical protein
VEGFYYIVKIASHRGKIVTNLHTMSVVGPQRRQDVSALSEFGYVWVSIIGTLGQWSQKRKFN